MQKRILIAVLLFAALGVGFGSARIFEEVRPQFINIFAHSNAEAPGIVWARDSALQAYPFRVEGELTFAGERVPLEEPDVKERLDRELQINVFRESNTILDMKLANRYFPEIEKILEEEGVPADFKYLPLIESDFRDVVSTAGAAGFWQFLPTTGKNYGLEINEKIDERYNVEKSTRAACQYLKLAKDKLGSWTASAASYNFGTDGVYNKLIAQHTSNYYDLAITAETARYVFRMLAMKVIFANPGKAGYHMEDEDVYQSFPYHTVDIDTTVDDLAVFCELNGIKYKELKLLNPWLRNTALPDKTHKIYQVKILTK